MTYVAFLFLSFMCVAAVGDWIAVTRGNRRLEYLCKPLTIAMLIGVALTVDPVDDSMRMWFVVGLMLSLVGDVYLMLPRDLFVYGLGAFLTAHLAYIVGMLSDEVEPAGILTGTAVAALAVALVGSRIVLGAKRRAPEMLGPVGLYILVISAMLVVAVGIGRPAAIIGAGFFVLSDALIGWTRFVRPQLLEGQSRMPLAIMVTYHVGQAGLVLSLASYGLWALAGTMVVLGLVLMSVMDADVGIL